MLTCIAHVWKTTGRSSAAHYHRASRQLDFYPLISFATMQKKKKTNRECDHHADVIWNVHIQVGGVVFFVHYCSFGLIVVDDDCHCVSLMIVLILHVCYIDSRCAIAVLR